MKEKASEIVIKCLQEKDMSQRQLATMLGEDPRRLNQQLRRLKDMKVGRFSDVIEHAGYRMEVVDNGGIQRVCKEFASHVIETREPIGRFYTISDGIYTGIDNESGDAFTEDFSSYEECMEWLNHKHASHLYES